MISFFVAGQEGLSHHCLNVSYFHANEDRLHHVVYCQVYNGILHVWPESEYCLSPEVLFHHNYLVMLVPVVVSCANGASPVACLQSNTGRTLHCAPLSLWKQRCLPDSNSQVHKLHVIHCCCCHFCWKEFFVFLQGIDWFQCIPASCSPAPCCKVVWLQTFVTNVPI